MGLEGVVALQAMVAVVALEVEHRVDPDAVRVRSGARPDDDDPAPQVLGGEALDLVLVHVFDAALGSVEILSDDFINQYVIVAGNQRMKVKEVLLMINEILDNKIKIDYTPAEKGGVHYAITPYCFTPKLAKRLISRTYVDLGQGILDCIHELHKSHCDYSSYDEFYNKIE